MFEHVSVEDQGLAKPLAITISFAGQATALIAAALLSFFHTDSLPRGLSFMRVAPPARSAGPEAPRAAHTAPPVSAKLPWRPFTQPARAPAQIAVGEIYDPMPAGAATVDFGRTNGIGVPSDYSGARLIELPHLSPPPPSKPIAQEKPMPPAPAKPIAVSKGVQAAKLIRQVKPVYPPLARQARISGTVRLTAIIGRNGAIEHLQLISGHPLLAPAAIEAVSQWLYQPTLLNGEPVEVVTQIEVNFTVAP